MKKIRVGWAIFGMVTAALCGNAWAQDADLIARAKQEGAVSIYSISPTPLVQAIADRFAKAYGIKVNVFRAGGAEIEQKLYLEMRTSRMVADVIEIGDPTAINKLAKRDGITSFKPANSADLPAGLVDPEGRWVTVGLNVFPIVYNKEKVSAADAPKFYKDLADPKWKGRIVLASPNYGSTQTTLVKGLIELNGWSFVEGLRANDPMVARGFPDLENVIATGERTVGIDISIRMINAIKQGAPLGVVFPADGTIAAQDILAITRAAPHPYAARLLEEFYLTDDMQKFLSEEATFPVKPAGGSPPGLPKLTDLKFHFINIAELEAQRSDMVARWTNLVER